MKLSTWFTFLLVGALAGCSQQDVDQAKRQMHEAKQEAKQTAQKTTSELKKEAHEASREIKEGAHEASREVQRTIDDVKRGTKGKDTDRKDTERDRR